MSYYAKHQHAESLGIKAGDLIRKKYMIGAEKHGGNIKRKLMLPHSLEEATDMMVYLLTLEEQWQGMIDVIQDTDFSNHDKCVTTLEKLHDNLTTGNEDGIEEEELEK